MIEEIEVVLGAGVEVEADIDAQEAGQKEDVDVILQVLLGVEVEVMKNDVRGDLHHTEVEAEVEVLIHIRVEVDLGEGVETVVHPLMIVADHATRVQEDKLIIPVSEIPWTKRTRQQDHASVNHPQRRIIFQTMRCHLWMKTVLNLECHWIEFLVINIILKVRK